VNRDLNHGLAGVAPSPSEAKRKTGRPRIGEIRDRPWEAAGMSRSTWYRRKAEAEAEAEEIGAAAAAALDRRKAEERGN